jgi:predicted small secreted protein
MAPFDVSGRFTIGTIGAADHFLQAAMTPDVLGDNIMRKLLGSALVAGMLMIAACNTVEGAGEDLQSAGKAVEKAGD